MKRLYIVLAIGTALSIAGCAGLGGIGSDARPRDVATLDSAAALADAPAGTWPRQDWWLRWPDPQLHQLIDEALHNQPSLAAAAARVRAAQAAVDGAHANTLPQVDASADVLYQRFTERGQIPPPLAGSFRSNSTVQLNFSYGLDFWGRNRAALASAVSSAQAEAAEAEAVRLLLATAIAKSYVELHRLYALQEVLQRALAQRQNILELTAQRVAAGLDTRVQLKQAETQLPAVRGQLAELQEATAATRHALASLAGAGPDRGLKIAPPQLGASTATGLPAQLPANLLGRRPDIVAARWRVEAALHATDAARAEFYPNIDLVAFAGFSSLGLDQLARSGSEIYGIGPALRLPIFNGGALRANLRGEYAAYDAAVAAYDGALLTALREVADQVSAERWLQVQQREQATALDAAEQALALATQRYQAGLGDYLTVLNTETAVLDQRRLGAELDARAIQAQIDLINALGGGFTERTTAQPTGDATRRPS